MKRKRARILLIIAAVFVIIAIVAGVNVAPLLGMQPIKTGLIPGTDIYAVNSRFSNMYLIPTEEGYIAIDAGTNEDTVRQGLGELAIDPADIAYVLLTHSDYDHVAALALFPNAQICLSEDELPMVTGVTKRSSTGYNSLPTGIEPAALELLAAGQELTPGGHTIRCLNAPGHTPGSMLYVLDEQYIFTGDALKVSGGTIAPGPYTMDTAAALATIQSVKETLSAGQTVFTAHYGYYAADDLH